MSSKSSLNSFAPVLVASVSAGAVGAYFFWRYQKAAKAVQVAQVELQEQKIVEEIKSQEETIFQTSGDDNIQVGLVGCLIVICGFCGWFAWSRMGWIEILMWDVPGCWDASANGPNIWNKMMHPITIYPPWN